MKTEDTDIYLQDLNAVIFDMDGVLIDSMPYHAQAWIEVLEAEGVAVRREDIYDREGEAGAASLTYFLRQQGVAPTPDRLQRLLAAKERRFKQIACLKPFDGVRELVAALRKLGKRLAIVTGTSRPEVEVSLPGDILEQYEVVVTGDQVTRGKPDPEPYLTALRSLGVSPARAVVIENAPLGVLSARAAGLRCLAVETSVQAPRLAGADRCFADIRSLADYLLR